MDIDEETFKKHMGNIDQSLKDMEKWEYKSSLEKATMKKRRNIDNKLEDNENLKKVIFMEDKRDPKYMKKINKINHEIDIDLFKLDEKVRKNNSKISNVYENKIKKLNIK
ncbi:MAG: hypothetical protein Q4Q23_05220 [Methanobacteriaceae archaeon]|nr:hypothetical protein [Methanobacteriaceae archaeon]